jgi:hypothetical protein
VPKHLTRTFDPPIQIPQVNQVARDVFLVFEASYLGSTFGDFVVNFKLDVSRCPIGGPIVVQVLGGYGFYSILMPT